MRDLSLRLILTAIADRFTQEVNNARRRLAELGGEAGAADARVGGFRQRVDRALLSVVDFGGAVRQLVMGFSLLAIALGLKGLIDFADRLRLIEGRIRNASTGLIDFTRNYAALVVISLRSGTAFAENAEMFGRIAGGIREMGGGSQDALRQVDLLAKGMSLSNTAAGEAASTIRQWSQAMASGVLRGDEFNSIMENAPRLARAIADGLHVSIGALRAMAEAGELTAQKVSKALVSQGKAIDDEFKKLPLSVGRAVENIKTAFGQYIAEADKGAGATAGLAHALDATAHNMRPLVDTAVTLGKLLALAFAGAALTAVGRYAAALLALAQAQHNAHSIASAHGEALIINAQRTVAHTQAQVADTQATLAVVQAARTETLARLSAANATIAQSQAAIAAMRTTVQTTSILHLLRQEEAALAATQAQRVAIVTELAALGAQQVAVSNSLTAATVAQTEAQAALNAASATTGITMLGMLKSLLNPMNLLNLAMAAMAGYAIGEWANSFSVVRGTAVEAIHRIVSAFAYLETVAKKAALYLSFKPRDGVEGWNRLKQAVAELDAQYAADQSARETAKNAMLDEIIATDRLSESTQKIISDFKNIKDPQQQFLQKQKELSEALKAGAITAQEYDGILQGLRKTMFEQVDAQKSPFAKLKDDLQDKIDKASLPPEAYQRKQLVKQGYSDTEIDALLPYYQRIDALSSVSKNNQSNDAKAVLDTQLAAIKTQQDSLQAARDNELANLQAMAADKELTLKKQLAAHTLTEQEYRNQSLQNERGQAEKELAIKKQYLADTKLLQLAEIEAKANAAKAGGGKLVIDNPQDAARFDKILADNGNDLPKAQAQFLRETGRGTDIDKQTSADKLAIEKKLQADLEALRLEAKAKSIEFSNTELDNAIATAEQKKAVDAELHKAAADAALADLDFKRQLADQDLELGKITAEEHLQRLKELAAEELQLRLKLLEDERKLSPSDPVAQAKITTEQRQVMIKFRTDTAGLDAATAKAEAASEAMQGAFSPLQNALSQSVNSVLTNQQTLTNAARNAGQSMLLSYASTFAKERLMQGAQWAWKLAGIKATGDMEKALKNGDVIYALWLAAKEKGIKAAGWAWETAGELKVSLKKKSIQLADSLWEKVQWAKDKAIKAASWAWETAGELKLSGKKKSIKLAESLWEKAQWVKDKVFTAAQWTWELLGFGEKESSKMSKKAVSETAQTGAQITGDVIRTASTVTAEETKKKVTAETASKSIMSKAYDAAAGVYTSLADIPYVGWILAPIAAAATFVTVAGWATMVGSAKGGEWEVDKDGRPFILHEKESVLPAGVADNFRSVVNYVKTNGLQPTDVSATVADLVASGKLHGNWTIPASVSGIAQQSTEQAATMAQAARRNDQAATAEKLAAMQPVTNNHYKNTREGDVHLNVSAVDGHSVKRLLESNMDTIARGVRDKTKSGKSLKS